jgi:hypothetical protein
MTKDNTQTYTLSGFDGLKIKGVTLSMKSNKSAGAGTFSITAGSTTLAQIATATNFNAWYNNNSYSQSFVPVNVELLESNYIVKNEENIVITISATTNSLFCESVTLEYE